MNELKQAMVELREAITHYENEVGYSGNPHDYGMPNVVDWNRLVDAYERVEKLMENN